MHRFLLVIPLLVLISGPTASEQASSEPEVIRLYDVTDLLSKRVSRPQHGCEFGVDGQTAWIHDLDGRPVYSPLYFESLGSDHLVDKDRLEELIVGTLASASRNRDDYEITLLQSGTRVQFGVRATEQRHEAVAGLLSNIRAYSMARVRIVLREGDSLIGNAVGAIGQELSVAQVVETPHLARTERWGDHFDRLWLETFRGGGELACWAVKLPNDKLRVCGRYFERNLTSFRAVPTQGWTLDFPEYEFGYWPFAVEVPDPGRFTIKISNGRELTVDVSCGAALPDFTRELPNGSILAYRNLLGSLRRPYSTGMIAGQYIPSLGPVIEYPREGPNSSFGERLEDRLGSHAARIDHDWWGYGQAMTWSPQSLEGDRLQTARQEWEEMLAWLDQLDAASPGHFRAKVWRVPESNPSAPLGELDDLGDPIAVAELSMFEGQTAAWYELNGTELVSGHGVWAAAEVGRNVYTETLFWGSELALTWDRGSVSAVWRHKRLLNPLEQFDTGLREPGPLVLENPTTRSQDLHWNAPLQVGEKSVAVSPVGGGEALVGVLERLE